MATEFDTRAIAENTTIPPEELIIRVKGYSAAGDGGAALYKRMDAPPSPERRWHLHTNAGTTWWDLADPVVNPVMMGCMGSGTVGEAGDVVHILNMFNAFKDVMLPAGRVFWIPGTQSITNTGLTIRGPGTIKLGTLPPAAAPPTSGQEIVIKARNVTIDGVTFLANNCHRVLNAQIPGARFTVRNCRFSGGCNNYVATSSTETTVQGNVFDCGSAEYLKIPVLLSGSDGRNHLCADNVFIEVFGFGVQATGSTDPGDQPPVHTGLYGVVIRNNRFINSIIEMPPQTLTQDQTSFTFSAPRRVNRWTVYIDGVPKRQDFNSSLGNTLPGVGPFTITRRSGSGPVPAGATVQFKFWRALESVNINRDCYDILIDGNVITGSGDSGIVLCNDKFEPGNYYGRPPADIMVSNNTISETAYAGCAETHSIDDVSYIGNRIQDYSLAVQDPFYSSAILTTGRQSTISGNVITGNGTKTRMGICVHGLGVDASTDTGNYTTQANDLISYTAGDNIVGSNVFQGSFPDGKCDIPQDNDNFRRQGNVFSDMPYLDYFGQLDTTTPLIAGLPPATPFLNFWKAGAGWTAATDDVPWTGATAFKIVDANRVDMILSEHYRGVLADTVMRVEFWAKTLSGTSYIGIISTLASQPKIVNLPITATTWRPYRILFPISASFVGNPIAIRHGTDTGGAGLICGLHVSYQAVPT